MSIGKVQALVEKYREEQRSMTVKKSGRGKRIRGVKAGGKKVIKNMDGDEEE